MRIAEQVFSPGELAELRALEEKARIERFFLLWSVKEAFAKARGEGLAAPLDRIEVSLAKDGEANMMMPPEITGGGDAWHVRWSRPSPEHVMATCVHSPDGRRANVVEHVGLG
jgi:4'-phosphopantetheinyl transferase